MNLKNARIKKLWDKGVTDPAKIAKKLGLADTARVMEGLDWLAATGEIARCRRCGWTTLEPFAAAFLPTGSQICVRCREVQILDLK